MSKEVAKKDNNLPAGMSEEMLQKLKEGSGEGEGPQFNFIPQIEVDNSTEVKTVDGEEVEVLCQPRWKITKMIEGERVTEPYHPSFGGVVLVIRYQVMKSYEPKEKQTLPWFYSNEFSAGAFRSNEVIHLKFEDEEVKDLTYQEIKAQYAGKYTLFASVYIWTDGAVHKLRLKKSNLTALWTYLKNFKGKDSVSAHPTVFGTIRKKEPKPYNTAEFKIAEDAPEIDWANIVKTQEELNSLFDSQSQQIIDAVGGDIVEEGLIEDIKVDDIPFN